MYRVTEEVEKMTLDERIDYFWNLGAEKYPEEKKEFTDEELMLSKGYTSYELFRNFAGLEEVGYFDFASRIFKDRFVGKWAEIERWSGVPWEFYVESICPPYSIDIETDECRFYTELDVDNEFWGALEVKNTEGGTRLIPFCYIRRIKLLDEPPKEAAQKHN